MGTKHTDPQTRALAVEQVRAGRSVKEVAEELKVNRAAVYRWLDSGKQKRAKRAANPAPHRARRRGRPPGSVSRSGEVDALRAQVAQLSAESEKLRATVIRLAVA